MAFEKKYHPGFPPCVCVCTAALARLCACVCVCFASQEKLCLFLFPEKLLATLYTSLLLRLLCVVR